MGLIRRPLDPRRSRLVYSHPINRSLLCCARWIDGAGELYGRYQHDYQAVVSNDVLFGSPRQFDGLFGFTGTTSSYQLLLNGAPASDRLNLGNKQTLGVATVIHSQWATPGQPNGHVFMSLTGNNGGTDTVIAWDTDPADNYNPVLTVWANVGYVVQADVRVKIPATLRNCGRPIVVVVNWTAAASGSGWSAYIDGLPVTPLSQSNSVSATAEVDGPATFNSTISSYATVPAISYAAMRLEPYTPAEVAALTADPFAPFRANRLIPIPSAAASGIPTLSALGFIDITATSARPQVTLTF